MSYSLAPFLARAHWIQDAGHFPAVEEVFKSDLLGSKLDKDRALSLAEAFMKLKKLL